MQNNKSKLTPIDKFHLTRLVESIAYLNGSETAKRWLAENDRKLLMYFSKFVDENLLEILKNRLNFFKNDSIFKI